MISYDKKVSKWKNESIIEYMKKAWVLEGDQFGSNARASMAPLLLSCMLNELCVAITSRVFFWEEGQYWDLNLGLNVC
jgi:hypothetical protein